MAFSIIFDEHYPDFRILHFTFSDDVPDLYWVTSSDDGEPLYFTDTLSQAREWVRGCY
ncbi:hypothetical protein [Ruminococcus sp.]|uniref:hypothetical protein n=1 Tax=Ruminococcus sp. TaxID=41978 RepID=UPI0025FEA88A|nr:hypothetical protein [Ruminococcus sp.]MBQ8966269.1 hypothetical protein [Ruminococcus sp.]